MSQLIPELRDIKNQYLDPISYLELISKKPEEFNPGIIPEIIKNYNKIFPTQYFKIFEISKQYAEKWNTEIKSEIDDLDSKIDPLYVSGILIKYMNNYGLNISNVHKEETEIRNKVYSHVTGQNVNVSTIEDFMLYLEVNDKVDLLKKVKTLYDSDDEKFDSLINTLRESLKIQKSKDPEFYDTDHWNITYKNTVPIFEELIQKI